METEEVEDSRYISFFYKVGKKENLELLRQGNIRFMSLAYYKSKEERNRPHFDEQEGIMSIHQPETTKLNMVTATHGSVPIKLAGPLMIARNIPVNIFCVSSIHSDSKQHLTQEALKEIEKQNEIDSKMREYGESVLVITSPSDFVDNLLKARERKDINLKAGLVEYANKGQFDNHVPDEKHGFVKLDNFKHEREYRFMIPYQSSQQNPLKDPYVLNIGTMEEYSFIVPFGNVKFEAQLIEPLVYHKL